MARKSRGRKGKAKKKVAKSASSSAASSSAAPSPKASDCEAVETEIEALETDVVIAPALEVLQPPPVIRSVVHQAEVIEIRPAAAPKPELRNDDLSLGEWDEPEFQDVPLPAEGASAQGIRRDDRRAGYFAVRDRCDARR